MAINHERVTQWLDSLDRVADGIESRAKAHNCRGADCSECYPNGVVADLRDLVTRLRALTSKESTAPDQDCG